MVQSSETRPFGNYTMMKSGQVLTQKMPRKIRKPMMEKRRRARINHSLESLKLMLIELQPEVKQVDKWEKADILEMTVNYLQRLRSGRVNKSSPTVSDSDEYKLTSLEEMSPQFAGYLHRPESTSNSEASSSPEESYKLTDNSDISLKSCESTRISETSSTLSSNDTTYLDMPLHYGFMNEYHSPRISETSTPPSPPYYHQEHLHNDNINYGYLRNSERSFSSSNDDLNNSKKSIYMVDRESVKNLERSNSLNLEEDDEVEINIEDDNTMWRPW